MTKTDLYLNKHILYMMDMIDAAFVRDGVLEFCNYHHEQDRAEFMEKYVKARWWIFCNQN